ncbi:MAG: hypothetical protein ACTHON_06260 [Humibacter sp.]
MVEFGVRREERPGVVVESVAEFQPAALLGGRAVTAPVQRKPRRRDWIVQKPPE